MKNETINYLTYDQAFDLVERTGNYWDGFSHTGLANDDFHLAWRR